MYRYLTGEKTNPGFSGEIRWNFEKFLVDRHGRVVARFDPRTTPDDPQVVKAIETELAKR
ncbi:Hydroperoxy fatty acid reductase gpx2 [compost metagenome]